MAMDGGWVLEVDIRKFFDTLDHGQLREIVRQRVRDGVLLRLIGKWLNAGVLEDGQLSHPEAGTPQGGVISPLLANIYLHEVLDVWFERDVRPRLKGRAALVRYADDFVLVFEREDDARRVWDVLPKRFGKYGLTLHPQKTRLVTFGRPNGKPGNPGEPERPSSFSFLGFTHHWGRTRKGGWAVMQRTARDRLGRAVKRVGEWCRRNLHRPVREQWEALKQKLRGHYAYFGLRSNSRGLVSFRYYVIAAWRRWLDRRSQRARMSWPRMERLLRRYPLPPARLPPAAFSGA